MFKQEDSGSLEKAINNLLSQVDINQAIAELKKRQQEEQGLDEEMGEEEGMEEPEFGMEDGEESDEDFLKSLAVTPK